MYCNVYYNCICYSILDRIFPKPELILIYSRDHVNRTLGGFEIPVAWLTSLNAILCVFLAPLIGSFWIKLSKTKKVI